MLGAWVTGVLGVIAAVDASVFIYTDVIPHLIAEEYRDFPASFGPDLPPEGLRGLAVPAAPADGCSALAPPPVGIDNFTGKWIAVIARYNCNFDTKVRNAQAAGYHCAIVHNVNSSDLETMSSPTPEGIDIPSVFVGEFAGKMLIEEYSYNSSYYVLVNGDVPFNINTQLILPFVVVVALCLLAILFFLLVKCIRERRRARRHRLPWRALKKIPTHQYSKGDPYDMCAICLDDYAEPDTLRVLPCAHAYHAKCIDQWLTENRRVCPVCKRRVIVAGEPAPPPDSDDDDDRAPLLARQTTNYGGVDRARYNEIRNLLGTLFTERNETSGPSSSSASSSTSARGPGSSQGRSRRGGRRVPGGGGGRGGGTRHSAPASPTRPVTGEIGVAALPATQNQSIPRHFDL